MLAISSVSGATCFDAVERNGGTRQAKKRRPKRIRVIAHGMLTATVHEPEGRIELPAPDGIDVRGVIEILSERSPLFEVRACLAVIDGVRVPLDQLLQDGEEVNLSLLFGGG
jgi:hypothetical protein